MNFILKCRAIGLLVLLAYASRAESPQVGIPDESLSTVSLCQLTRDWEKYDHKIVRIESIYHTGNEVSQLYDPGCATSDQTAWVKLLPYGSPSPVPPRLKQKLNELLRRTGRAQITAIGEFDGPKRANIPSGLSLEAANAMRETNSRYGHMNGWKFQFVFSKIEKVESVTSDTPWPRLADQKKQ
jgi:hypothetical protein